MPTNKFTFNLLKLKDHNITINEELGQQQITKKGITYNSIFATLTYTPCCCGHCGCINNGNNIIKYGFKRCQLRYTKVAEYPFIIQLRKQRYLCKECGRTFSAETSEVKKHHQISKALRAKISKELKKIQSMKDIGERCLVSSATVNRVCVENAQAKRRYKPLLPECLAFDEFKSVKRVSGAMSFVMSNAHTHELLEVLPNRKQDYLIYHFNQYPYEERKQVKYITMDMYSPYIGVVEHCFPNAKIVIDRFHVVQHLNRALNRMRREVMNRLRYTRPTDYRKLKKKWKLILKNADELDCEKYKTDRLFTGMVTDKIMVDYMLSLDPRFRETYEIINDLKYDIKHHDLDYFKQDIEKSKQVRLRKYVRVAIQSVERFYDGIEMALTVTLSNGHLEGINNKIKTIKRVSFGYSNFTNFRSRILACFDKPTQAPRPILFTEEESQQWVKAI